MIPAAPRRPVLARGMLFTNPVPLMTLVEIVRALDTSDAGVEVTAVRETRSRSRAIR